jgi:hypothetical protein
MQAVTQHSPRFFVPTQPDNSAPTHSIEDSKDELLHDLAAPPQVDSSILPESLASLSGTAPEIQVSIGKHLEIRDVLRLSQVSRNLHNSMSTIVTDYTAEIKVPRMLTAEIISGLSKVKNLCL